jgi:hypothetical protein
MKKLILPLLFLIISISAFSQISYEKRIEIELKDNLTNEKNYQFGENGFLLQAKAIRIINHKMIWDFKFYDTNLNLAEHKEIKLCPSLILDECICDSINYYALLQNYLGNFTIITANSKTHDISTVSGKVPTRCKISEMAVLGNYAYFNSKIKKIPYLFVINIKTGQQKPIPFHINDIKPKSIKLENFQIIENSNEVILQANTISKKAIDTYIIRLDNQGDKKDMFNFTKEIDDIIMDISSLYLGEDNYIYTGTYSKNTINSSGIYFCKTSKGEISHYNTYNFMDLNNFMSYLPEKKQEHISQKKSKKAEKGKQLNISYYIEPHKIIQRDDGYIFIGEAYYPTYRTETYSTTTTNKTINQKVKVFDGYHYTHAFIAKFGNEGNIEWDQTFELNPTEKPLYIKKFISIDEEDKNEIKMLYVSKDKIYTKTIDNSGNITNDFKTETIETANSEDKTKQSFSKINYWYNNAFLAYGTQKIKNKKDENVKRKRTVFYISKILFN